MFVVEHMSVDQIADELPAMVKRNRSHERMIRFATKTLERAYVRLERRRILRGQVDEGMELMESFQLYGLY